MNRVLVHFVLKRDPEVNFLRFFRSKEENLVSSARLGDVILQASLSNCVQARENTYEIRLTGSVGTNQHVNRAQSKLLDRRNALESLNSDVVEFGDGHN